MEMIQPESKKIKEENPLNLKKIKRIKSILEKERSWEKIEQDLDKILKIIQDDSLLNDPSIKNFTGPLNIKLKNTTPEGIFYFETNEELPILSEKFITIYKQSNGYQVELDFELLSINSKLIACKPVEMRKGENLRRHQRIKSEGNAIYGSHFLVAKIDKDLDSYMGYATEVIFKEICKEFQEFYPTLKLVYTYKKFERFPELVAMQEEGKPIYLEDTLKMKNASGDFVDIVEFYESEDILSDKKTQFFKEKISSFIYYPIYFRLLQEEIFIGYGYLPFYAPEKLNQNAIDMFQRIESKIIQTILDSHTIMIDDKQSILNYSENGLLLEVKNELLGQGIIIKPSFSADITFKMQSPLRLALVARNIYKIEDAYFVGAEIVGATNDPTGLEKYRNSIQQRK
jgi:hypothetical protein